MKQPTVWVVEYSVKVNGGWRWYPLGLGAFSSRSIARVAADRDADAAFVSRRRFRVVKYARIPR